MPPVFRSVSRFTLAVRFVRTSGAMGERAERGLEQAVVFFFDGMEVEGSGGGGGGGSLFFRAGTRLFPKHHSASPAHH